jgi:hypothetical protein
MISIWKIAQSLGKLTDTVTRTSGDLETVRQCLSGAVVDEVIR